MMVLWHIMGVALTFDDHLELHFKRLSCCLCGRVGDFLPMVMVMLCGGRRFESGSGGIISHRYGRVV